MDKYQRDQNAHCELFHKKTGKREWTLGHFLNSRRFYTVYDGADYINFKKSEYEIRKVN